MLNNQTIAALAICGMVLSVPESESLGQVIRAVRPFSKDGTILALKPGRLSLADSTGKSWQLYVGSSKNGRVSLGGQRAFIAPPPKVTVTGELDLGVLEKGARVQFDGFIDERKGTLSQPVNKLVWAASSGFKPGVQTNRRKKDAKGNVACRVSASMDSIRRGRLSLRLPRSKFASKGRMLVPLAADAKVVVSESSLAKVQDGDLVTKATGVELNTGELVLQEIEIRLVNETDGDKPKKEKSKTTETSTSVDPKYGKLSTESVAPRIKRSQNYILHTDISDRDAQILLDKLEQMLGLVARYYGRRQPAPAECYVVGDLKSWPNGQFPEDVREKIESGAGVTKSLTMSTSNSRRTKATVFSSADHGVVQHEAVHAYCRMAFGSTGPLWYAEGMAEMGQYWKESQRAVNVNPYVIRYFKKKKTKPRSVREILSAKSISSDETFEEYSWRWALCYLLANNPNYARKFKELGIGLMLNKPGITFEKAYGKVAKQLVFEFKQFIKDVENGYRADLCHWRWNHKFSSIGAKDVKRVTVQAQAGWQPAIEVEANEEYAFTAEGTWSIEGTGKKLTAQGDKDKLGRLVGIVFQDYSLSQPIPLGEQGTFRAPTDGQLYVRCEESWARIGDNSGSLNVQFRKAQP